MKTALAELRRDGIARRRSSSVLTLVRALRMSRWINVRRGACEAQAIAQKRKRHFPIYLGEGLATRRVSLESYWAWIVIISTVHALRHFLTTEGSSGMGYARNRPKLLPEKLRLIREHLQLDHTYMTEQLVSDIESHTKWRIQIKPHWVPNFELGKHEPDLITVNSYSRLAKVSMNLIVDDDVSAEEFRKRLGKELKHKKKVVQHTKKRAKA